MKKIKCFIVVFLLSISSFAPLFAQVEDDQIQISGRENALHQQDKPYVILISIDGFRHDYFDLYKPKFLSKIRKKGTAAKAMIPSFPSVTFPNHYTLVTGLIPPHHGLIGNRIYDPKMKEHYSLRDAKAVQNPDWYGGLPIWSLAESQGLLSACFYWPGSEAPIGGYYPTYYYPYGETKGAVERIKSVVNWLNLPEEKRPHLLTFYMPQVDQAGHKFGPVSIETQAAVQLVDATLEKLYKEVSKTNLPVNFILVSDHGMTDLDTKNPLATPKIEEALLEEVVINGTYVSIFVKDKSKIPDVYKTIQNQRPTGYAAYLKEEIPRPYEFSSEHDVFNRVGDIVLIAEAPHYFATPQSIPKGSHGFLPEETPDMNTVFMAWGPQIKKRKKIAAFQNIHIFPLLAHLLDLDYDVTSIDGDDRLIKQVVKH